MNTRTCPCGATVVDVRTTYGKRVVLHEDAGGSFSIEDEVAFIVHQFEKDAGLFAELKRYSSHKCEVVK